MSMLHAVLSGAASRVDAGVRLAMFHPITRGAADRQTEKLGHAERMARLEEIARIYDRAEHYEDPATFFPAPGEIRPSLRRVRALAAAAASGRGRVEGAVYDASWPSGYEPHCREVAASYLAHEVNGRAAARLYLHTKGGAGPDRTAGRPAVLLLHGYKCGQWAIEERVWPIDWLFSLGLDVAVAVLPFHAVRSGRGTPSFPASDPRITNEGFRQAVHDLRGLMGWLTARGATAVGAMGMSLGGYTASLLATVDERLSFAVPMIPVASLAEAVRGIGRYSGTEDEQLEQYRGVERALRAVSPLSRPPRMARPRERMLVVAASGDRITPLVHARWIAEHFDAPLLELTGGHLMQFWRAEAFRNVGKLLGKLGLLDAPSGLVGGGG